MEMLNKSLIGILQVEEINQQKNIKIDEANSASKYFPHFQEAWVRPTFRGRKGEMWNELRLWIWASDPPSYDLLI